MAILQIQPPTIPVHHAPIALTRPRPTVALCKSKPRPVLRSNQSVGPRNANYSSGDAFTRSGATLIEHIFLVAISTAAVAAVALRRRPPPRNAVRIRFAFMATVTAAGNG